MYRGSTKWSTDQDTTAVVQLRCGQLTWVRVETEVEMAMVRGLEKQTGVGAVQQERNGVMNTCRE